MIDKKIMIDFRHIPNNTGFSSYLKMILSAINTVDREFYLLINDDSFDFSPYLTNNKNIKFVYAKSKPFSISQNWEVPLIIRKYKIDIFHAINYDVPLFMFLCPKCTLISTICDLIPILHKNIHKRSLIKTIYFEVMYRACVKLSYKLLTISEYSKNDIVNYLKVDKDSVTTIYCSYNGKELHQKEDVKINNPVTLFFIGTNFEHKNILVLVEAVKILKEKGISAILNIAGKETSYTDRIRDYVKEYNLEDSVQIHGKVTDEQAEVLYKTSDIFCFPSLVEGFGIPPLEAMNHGIPVISSNKTCIPEVVGDAGISIEPTAKNYAEKIEFLVNNPDTVKNLVKKGYERIKEFSQKNFDEKILGVYFGE